MTPTTYDIRLVPSPNKETLELANYAFTSTPRKRTPEEEEQYLNTRSDDKAFFSYVEDEAVARVGVIPMTMNVRGQVMPMGGISGVCSMPAARRGGHVRALMQRAIEQMHADGQPVSTLYPFKASYYEMFGYAGWQAPMWARIEPAAMAPYLRVPKTGSVKQRLSSVGKDDFYMFLTEMQKQVHGMSRPPLTRHEGAVKEHETWFTTVHEGDEITAGINYKMDLDKEHMVVAAAFWCTMNGKLNILDFMARHVDQVKEIRMPLLPGEEPHLWLTDDFRVSMLSNEDHSYSWGAAMGRIVSVAGLGGIPAGDGTVSLNVRDDQAPWNNGTWKLTGNAGVLDVSPGSDPQGDVSINGLSALLMSGLDPQTLPHRGWGEATPAAQEALRSIFPPITPHLHELF